ncbi:MAG TPA: glycosyltransferase family 4 protein [Polyangiaceae bacterium]|nr:glycosyltransferase family 4 protein [Polyangiaceae bacterium]
MRIAVVTTSYPTERDPGGHFVKSEVQALVSEGHEVSVLMPAAGTRSCPGNPSLQALCSASLPRGESAFGWPGVVPRLRAAPWRMFGIARFVALVRQRLRRMAPARIVLHWLLPVAPLVLSGVDTQACEVEIVVHGSDARLLMLLPRRMSVGILKQLLRQRVLFRCVSEALAHDLRALVPEIERSCSVAPCRIEVPKIDRQHARRRLQIEQNAFLAVVVGRLLPSKRVDCALECAPVPRGARWVVVGDGPLQRELERRFPNVQFVGRTSHVDALTWIAAADVLVSASEHEGSPSTVREARALGTLVWAAPAGDLANWAARDPGIRLLPELASRG